MQLQDNGVHEFFEDDKIVVFRNHGEKRWVALMKQGGGFRLLGQSKRRPGDDTTTTVKTFATAEEAVAFARKDWAELLRNRQIDATLRRVARRKSRDATDGETFGPTHSGIGTVPRHCEPDTMPAQGRSKR